MSDEKKSRGLLDNLHLGMTTVVLGLGVFISWKQLELAREQKRISERQTITLQSAQLLEKTRTYLEALELEEAKKKRILLSLLKIEKEIRISETGELGDLHVRKAVDELPYHLALLVGDSEALAHIGGQPADLELWLPIAKTSGDLEVRRTAIDALNDVALLRDDVDTIKVSLESIVELTRRWNVPELAEQARNAVTAIAKSYRRIGPEESDLHVLIENILRELEGSLPETPTVRAASTGAPPAAAATDELASSMPSDGPEVRPLSGAQDTELAELAVGTEATIAKTTNLTALRELRQSYETAASADRNARSLVELIDQLRSDEVKERRVARSKIADYGDQAVTELFAALKDNPDDYRIATGVVTALSLMEPGTSIAQGDVASLAALLGHPDSTLRENTAVYLGRLSDPASLEAVRQALEDLSADPAVLANQNLIDNSVIVLGDWLIYNQALTDDLRSRVEQLLKTIKERLSTGQEHTWRNTRAKIAQYLESAGNGDPAATTTTPR